MSGVREKWVSRVWGQVANDLHCEGMLSDSLDVEYRESRAGLCARLSPAGTEAGPSRYGFKNVWNGFLFILKNKLDRIYKISCLV